MDNKWFGDSLPLNSSATDIFIEDDNCLVDFNPSNSEFNALQNQVGLKEVGILTVIIN